MHVLDLVLEDLVNSTLLLDDTHANEFLRRYLYCISRSATTRNIFYTQF